MLDVFHDTITIKLVVGNESWTLTGMYASPIYTKRLELWHYLSSFKETIIGPWMIIGDFNEIILSSKQKGSTFNQARVDALIRTMEDCNLIDVSMTGATFTWAKNCVGLRRVAKKLDRGVAILSWRLSWITIRYC